MKKAIAAAMLAVLCGCGTEQTSYTQEEMTRVLWRVTWECEGGLRLSCRYLVPALDSVRRPLVVFLHGAGRQGDDNVSQLYEGDVGRLTYYAHTSENKAVVMVPQCPAGREWTDEAVLEALDECVGRTLAKFPVDPGRVFVSGFSMGGIGAYKLALRNPGRYSALMPICGGPRPWREKERDEVPEELMGASVWAFNNYNDEAVDNMYSKHFVSQLWLGEASDARYTEGNRGHCDEYVFEGTEAMEWLLTRPGKAGGGGK